MQMRAYIYSEKIKLRITTKSRCGDDAKKHQWLQMAQVDSRGGMWRPKNKLMGSTICLTYLEGRDDTQGVMKINYETSLKIPNMNHVFEMKVWQKLQLRSRRRECEIEQIRVH